MTVVPADTLPFDELVDVFNEGFSEYVVPLRFDAPTLRTHVEVNDVDLGASQVVLADGRPAAFALIGVRGEDAWVGGMGTAPAQRGHGLGEAALRAGLAAAVARGCRQAWLEVILGNEPAIALYAKLGFEHERDVVVWSLPAASADADGARIAAREAHAWIAAHRRSREPWQRADATIDRLRERRVMLRGLAVDGAALLFRDDGPVLSALQVAAESEDAAATLLAAAAARGKDVRLANVPADDPVSAAFERLGAQAVVRQHELRLALG